MMMKQQRRVNETGAVSIFVVIFCALAIIIMAVGFLRIMMQDQQQASNADLSQSAYDAAQAGVEDAKRALLAYQAACDSGDVTRCAEMKARLNSQACDTLEGLVSGVRFVDTEHGRENVLQVDAGGTSGTGASFNQAYTCVKVLLDTPDYLGELADGQSQIIPLRTDTPGSTFDKVKIEWFTTKDSGGSAIDLLSSAGDASLPTKDEAGWPGNRPAIARAQLFQFAQSGLALDTLSRTPDSNSRTLFLYPSRTGAGTTTFSSDLRNGQNTSENPQVVKCESTVVGEQYSCSVIIDVPNPVGGSPANRIAYLRLSALYNSMNYRILLYSGTDTTPVKFYAVQPSVDATGRAADQFRRVDARVEIGATNDFPFPENALDVTGSLCKDFLVTESPEHFRPSVDCTP